MRYMLVPALGLAIILGAQSPAIADDPTAEERTRIEAALKKEGFVRWDDIERDDGKWEVDDAVHADGKKYDLELDLTSLRIIKRELD
jgi:hypothetical protein